MIELELPETASLGQLAEPSWSLESWTGLEARLEILIDVRLPLKDEDPNPDQP